MHGISFAAWAPPQTPLWGFISPHTPPPLSGEGKGREGEVKGRERKGRGRKGEGEMGPAVALKPQGPDGP